MDSVIEVQRQTHEEIERLERALYTLLSRNPATHEIKLQNEHKASQVLDRISSRVTALNGLYSDEAARKEDIDNLTAKSQPNDLSEFYSRLVKIQEHYNKYPDAVVDGLELELDAFLYEPDPEADEDLEGEDRELRLPYPRDFDLMVVLVAISLMFSGEEAYGKYLDLYANHSAYNNLKNLGKRPGYLQYLDLLMNAQFGPVHRELSQETRATKDYEAYVGSSNSVAIVEDSAQLHSHPSFVSFLILEANSTTR